MGAKFKSKTHLQNTFFDFLSRFLRVCSQSSKKVLIWPKKLFLEKLEKDVKKRISNPLKKLWKNVPKKSYKQNEFWRTWVKWKKCIFPSRFC